ncbi:MAG: serine protease [Candidatus Pacebacteria bacterium]|nr:serine protease [Candidatus Paceibacterota bacterium]
MSNKTLVFIVIIVLILQSSWVAYSLSNISKVEMVQKETTVILTKEDFIQEYLQKIQKSVLYVEDLDSKKESSGIILTSDGLILTLNDNIVRGNDFDFRFLGESKVYEIRKRDAENNLALVQVGEINLTPCPLSDEVNVILGENVYIVGTDKEGNYVFGEGIIKTVSGKTDILGDSSFNGAPVFNKKGEILGIGQLNNGLMEIILINNIKDFTNL